jgi:hypothetical protein
MLAAMSTRTRPHPDTPDPDPELAEAAPSAVAHGIREHVTALGSALEMIRLAKPTPAA